MRLATDLIMGVWTAPEVPLLIEYPLEIMEDLRALLSDELQQLSRAGTDAAGVLFGVSRGPAIRVLAWRPLSLTLSDEQLARISRNDRAEMVRVLGNAASDPEMRGFEPLGWFVSHSDGGRGLTGADVELFNNFFPHSWQVTLLLRRGAGGTARAGFFVREPDGFLRPDASYRELLIQPLRRMPGATVPKPPQPVVSPLQEIPRPLASMQPGIVESAPTRQDPTPSRDPIPVAMAVEQSAPPHAPDQTSTHLGSKPHSPLDPEAVSDVAFLAKPPMPVETALSDQASPAGEPIASAPAIETEVSPGKLSAPIARPPLEPVMPQQTAPVENIARIDAQPAVQPPASIAVTPPRPFVAAPAVKLIAPEPIASEPIAPATPSFTLQTHSFGGSRWLWIISVLVVLAVVGFLIMQRATPAPAPSFSLRVGTVDDNIEISWDRDSIPVRNGEYASIQIQRGPNSKKIPLSSNELHAGTPVYLRESGDVAVQMTIYGAGREFHEFARLVTRPVPATGARPEPEPLPTPTSQLRAERDNLQSQVQLLKEQVRKEAARADQAEDVVRILENRLKIDAGRARPEEKK
jgi:hypothetical protein